MHADVGSGLVPQIPHEVDQFAVDDSRIGPLPIERRGGGDVLGDLVDERRERLDLAARPELGPLLVAAPAEDDRVLLRDDGAEVGIHRVVPVGEEPIGLFRDAVEGQQLIHDDLAHVQHLRLTWTLLCGRLARPKLIGAIIMRRLSDSFASRSAPTAHAGPAASGPPHYTMFDRDPRGRYPSWSRRRVR